MTARRHEHVGRLEIAVHDARLVRGVECIGDLNRQREQLVDRQAMGVQVVAQGSAVEPFHRDERPAVVFTNLVDGADVGMIQRRRGSCFAPETLDRTRIVSEVGRKELERNLSTERQVLCEEHDTHSAAAQQGMYAIAADRFTRGHRAVRPVAATLTYFRSSRSTSARARASTLLRSSRSWRSPSDMLRLSAVTLTNSASSRSGSGGSTPSGSAT